EDFEEEDIDTETADMRTLVGLLVESIIAGDERRVEYTFQQIVNIVHESELFDWLIDGKEVAEHEASTGALIHKDFVLKSDSKSKFGKLLKRYMPYSGELQGPRFRLWHIGKNDQCRQIRTSSTGQTGRRKFIVELNEKK